MKSLFTDAVDFHADRARLFSRAPIKIFLGHIGSACLLIYYDDGQSVPYLSSKIMRH
ncbi:hypothetical protein [Lentilitoribacter sp. Alg239-R112]|uniref:hypothetical protein n=1 Tax=Lentilitoribacter sp. Alg239-R112 TaxID=2305987 RepID=UPI0013A6DD6C|nr:hypothetical protein [Lentilitoribacter sp. Alg239-R112]